MKAEDAALDCNAVAKLTNERCRIERMEDKRTKVEGVKRKEREGAVSDERRKKRKEEECPIRKKGFTHWSDIEISQFKQSVIKYGWGNWSLIASYNAIPSRNLKQMIFRCEMRRKNPDFYTQLLLDRVASGRVALLQITNII